MILGYKIEVEGKVVSSTGDARLVEITLTDEVGYSADVLTMTFDDSGKTLAFPRRGVEVKVSLGYGGSLVDMGSYYVDSVISSEPPSLLQIGAKAVPFIKGKAMQARRCESYEGMSLASLARTIAARYQLGVKACEEAQKEGIGHVDQVNESDIGFLSRVALSLGYIVKPCVGCLLLDKRFSGKSVSGKALEARIIERESVSNWNAAIYDKGSYGSVVAEYRDLRKGGTQELVVGVGEPELRLPHIYARKWNAENAAKNKLRDLDLQRGMQINLSKEGDATLFSGLPILLKNFRQGVDGLYYIGSVTHTLSRAGFISSLVAFQKPAQEEERNPSSS